MLKQIYECDNCGKKCKGGNSLSLFVEKKFYIAQVGDVQSADICSECIEAIENVLQDIRYGVKKKTFK